MGWLHPRYDHVERDPDGFDPCTGDRRGFVSYLGAAALAGVALAFPIKQETIVTKIISIMAVAFALAAGSITVMTVQHRFIATYENRQSWIEPACGPVQSLPSVTP